MNTLMLFSAALAYSMGGVFMKYSGGFTRLMPALVAVLIIVLGVVAHSFAMRQIQLSVAYVLVLGLEATLALAFGVVFFGEQLSFFKGVGLGLVLAGILVMHAAELKGI